MLKNCIKILIIFIGLLYLNHTVSYIPSFINTFFSFFIHPLLLVQHKINRWIQEYEVKKKTHAELLELLSYYKKEAAELFAQNNKLRAVNIHMHDIQNIESFKKRYQTDYMVLTQIILRQFSAEGHFILIEGGSNRGIKEDMVAVYQNCLIGRVSEVSTWYSKVTLITDLTSKIPAVCAETSCKGICSGTNDYSMMQLDFVGHLYRIDAGDIIFSSGEGSIYPKGFALGKIDSFYLDDLGLNYIIKVSTLLSIQEILYCFILQRGAEFINNEQQIREDNELSDGEMSEDQRH